MVRRGDGNHVHILIVQNLADALDAIGRIFEFALNKFFTPSKRRESGSTKWEITRFSVFHDLLYAKLPRPLIPQTATLIRSFEPMILPDDFVPLIANRPKAEEDRADFRIKDLLVVFIRINQEHAPKVGQP